MAMVVVVVGVCLVETHTHTQQQQQQQQQQHAFLPSCKDKFSNFFSSEHFTHKNLILSKFYYVSALRVMITEE